MLKCSFWALLPPLYSAFTATGLWVVYFIAVSEEKIVPLSSKHWRRNGSFYPPYISIAGNFPPASCIFSEVMNLSAFGGFIIAVLRYLQLRPRLQKAWLNVACLVAFSLGCFGMTLLGNFQLLADEIIHNLGTFMTFGLGSLYCWAQSFITLRVNIQNEGRKAAIIRLLLSAAIAVCMILHFSLMGQGLHMHGARCQWALVMLFIIFIGTFGIEFRHCCFDAVCKEKPQHPVNLSQAFSEVSRYQADQL